VIRGEIERRAGDRLERVRFERKGEGFEVTREVATPSGEAKADPVHVKAPKDATTGLVSMILFARALPNDRPRELAFPWFAAEELGASVDDHAPDTGKGPARLDVGGEGKFRDAATGVASFRRGQHALDVHLAPKDRTLVAVVGRVPPVNYVAKGTAGERTESDAEKPAKTWKAAFLKFGHGYHMAVRPWIEAAFHWQTMYDHETGEGNSWPKEKPLEEFKAAWVDEFLANSKRRSREETDDLLAMTLATGRVTEETEDRIVFAAHPSFGGGTQRTYHLRRIEGVWYIVRID
jgi:hypothetical protein